jgi:hypothetical protein
VLEVRRLRVDEQARRRRKGRTLRFLGSPAMPSGRPIRARPPEYLRREFDEAVELAGATGEHHAPARLGREMATP